MPHRTCIAVACVAMLSFAARRHGRAAYKPARRSTHRGCFAAAAATCARASAVRSTSISTGKTARCNARAARGPREEQQLQRRARQHRRPAARWTRHPPGLRHRGRGRGRDGQTLRTNVTVLFEGEQRVFATQGDDKCTVDSLTQERVEVLGPGAGRVPRGGTRLLHRAGHQPVARGARDPHQLRFCRPRRIRRR